VKTRPRWPCHGRGTASPSAPVLKIDAKSAADSIADYIKRIVDANSAQGVIIGLSGGIDSAVLAALAVRAVGKDRVYAWHLYDRDTPRQARRRVKLVADWLGLQLQLHDIEPVMRHSQIYRPLIMRISALSGSANRLLAGVWRFFYHESPFISTLHKGSFTGLLAPASGRGTPAERRGLRQFFYDRAVGHVEAAFNARHIYRRQFIEKLAEERNLLLLGAANRSEYLIGWFVKDGIDDLFYSPLIGLYKTQVQQLAHFLGIPIEVREQPASPDMIKGITDEFAIGLSYAKVDLVLNSLERGLSDEEMLAAGVSEKQISCVRKMYELSAWKRGSEHAQPPPLRRQGQACPRESGGDALTLMDTDLYTDFGVSPCSRRC